MFMAGRVFMDARYMFKFPHNEQYIVIFSSNGNSQLLQDYARTHDLEGSAIASCQISGHWFMPLYDQPN